jgi:3-dehydroquinate synthase class II
VQIIPAENLVATFQSSAGKLMGVVSSAADARVMLEALETGTAGVLLRTQDPLQASGCSDVECMVRCYWQQQLLKHMLIVCVACGVCCICICSTFDIWW